MQPTSVPPALKKESNNVFAPTVRPAGPATVSAIKQKVVPDETSSSVEFVVLDASSSNSIQAAVRDITQRFGAGSVDLLVRKLTVRSILPETLA